jgi:hypothetical protein
MQTITLKAGAERQHLLFKLNRDWPAMRYGLKNGRKLNRLSTKQLQAKWQQFETMQRDQRTQYIAWLDRNQVAA